MALAREFQALASLHHPNIVTVLDYGFDTDDTPYLVMELFEGAHTICDAGQQQPLSIQIALLVQLLQALAYIHRRGIVHRDLKPGNVLVTHEQVKVLDFGLAVDRGKSSDVVGTLTYMPPEVLMGRPADASSDLYSFGMIACELFAGKHPFKKGDDADVTRLIHTQIMEMIQHLPPEGFTQGLEPGIAAVWNRLLQKQPADRYASAEQVMKALTNLVDQPLPVETAAIRESFLQAAQFIGRDRELVRLSAALSEANAGKGSVWLVGGESGVGKSRLVEELRVRALEDSGLARASG